GAALPIPPSGRGGRCLERGRCYGTGGLGDGSMATARPAPRSLTPAVLAVAAAVAGGWSRAVAWGIALLAAGYAISVLGEGSRLDLTAPLFGALLVVTAELAYTACEWRGPHAVNRAAEVRRGLRLTGVVALGALIGLGALGLTSAWGAGSPAVLVAGGAAGILLLVLVAM